jgi:hypothetical protein
MDSKPLSFDYDRRFGTETEVPSFDHRDFKRYPLNAKSKEQPEGMEYLATMISTVVKHRVECNKWHHTHNNDSWVLKPDSSCGIEICSPVYKGWHGLRQVVQVTKALADDPRVDVDSRCGFHVHLGIEDCDPAQTLSILSHWIKCEAVFMDSVPFNRKNNRYCQLIGHSPLFDHNEEYSLVALLQKLGNAKYFSLNAYHLNRGSRSTIESRIAEESACVDPFYVKNWVRLLIHFVECAKARKPPGKYNGDSWSGLVWLDLNEVMEFLRFNEPLSKGMEQVRNWFLARIRRNVDCSTTGAFAPEARKITKLQIEEIWTRLGLGESSMPYISPSNLEEALYGQKPETKNGTVDI